METEEGSSGAAATGTVAAKKRFEVKDYFMSIFRIFKFTGQKVECRCTMGLGHCRGHLCHLPKPHHGSDWFEQTIPFLHFLLSGLVHWMSSKSGWIYQSGKTWRISISRLPRPMKNAQLLGACATMLSTSIASRVGFARVRYWLLSKKNAKLENIRFARWTIVIGKQKMWPSSLKYFLLFQGIPEIRSLSCLCEFWREYMAHEMNDNDNCISFLIVLYSWLYLLNMGTLL